MSENKRKRAFFEAMNEYLEKVEALVKELNPTASVGPSWNTETCCLHALSNVFITPREVIVTADLPNIDPETVKVETIDENFIEITAKMREKVRFTDLGIHHRQGEFSFLRCQGRVQVAFDSEKMKISCEKGILEVRLPRKIGHMME
jgi:HSP20 family molecular chaperone IbpA